MNDRGDDVIIKVKAVYPATLALVATEQQGIWSRTQGFFAIATVAAGGAAQYGSRPLQLVVGVVGVIVTVVFALSLLKSWTYRDAYISVVESHESSLELGGEHGPFTAGKAHNATGVSQKFLSFTLTGVALLVFVMLALHGGDQLPRLDFPAAKPC